MCICICDVRKLMMSQSTSYYHGWGTLLLDSRRPRHRSTENGLLSTVEGQSQDLHSSQFVVRRCTKIMHP